MNNLLKKINRTRITLPDPIVIILLAAISVTSFILGYIWRIITAL